MGLMADPKDIMDQIYEVGKKFGVNFDDQIPFRDFTGKQYLQFYGTLFNRFQTPEHVEWGEAVRRTRARQNIKFTVNNFQFTVSDFDGPYSVRKHVEDYLESFPSKKKHKDDDLEM